MIDPNGEAFDPFGSPMHFSNVSPFSIIPGATYVDGTTPDFSGFFSYFPGGSGKSEGPSWQGMSGAILELYLERQNKETRASILSEIYQTGAYYANLTDDESASDGRGDWGDQREGNRPGKGPVGPFEANPNGGGEVPESKNWDLNDDGRLSKFEADDHYMRGNGQSIIVNNEHIDWTGLKIPEGVKIGEVFSIATTEAFKKLPLFTAATYGGTSFRRTGESTVEVLPQLYHYATRPNNSWENIKRNIANEIGKPAPLPWSGLTPKPYMIYYANPIIFIK